MMAVTRTTMAIVVPPDKAENKILFSLDAYHSGIHFNGKKPVCGRESGLLLTFSFVLLFAIIIKELHKLPKQQQNRERCNRTGDD